MKRILLVLLAFPAMAWAQDEVEGLKARIRARAQADGVPSAPLERKVAEGVAKGVPLDLIERVVDGLHGRLREAATHCAGWSRREACALAGADALQVGLTGPALREVLATQGGIEEERLAALFAVSDLRARGVPTEAGLALVGQVRGQGPEAARAMVKDILEAIEAGGSPAEVAGRAIERGKPDREGHYRVGKAPAKPEKPEKPDKPDRPDRPQAPETNSGQGRNP